MKKRISVILLALFLCLMMLSLFGCGIDLSANNNVSDNDNGGNGGAHQHVFDTIYWYSDASMHWHGTDCNVNADCASARIDVQPHTDGDGDDFCDECGHYFPPPHVHSFESSLSYDKTGHWYAASCDYDSTCGSVKHEFGVHTNDGNGCCSVCGYDLDDVELAVGDYVFKSVDGVHYLVGYTGSSIDIALPTSYMDESYRIAEGAFRNSTVASVTIYDGVESVGDCAFEGCMSLESVIIGDSVISVGASAFYGCTGLMELSIGKKVEEVGSYAFHGCTSLQTVYFHAALMQDLSAYNAVFSDAGVDGDGIRVVIGKDVTRIPAYLFSPNKNNFNSPKITSVEFEDVSTCESIGAYALAYNVTLASIELPDSVKTVEDYAFYASSGLERFVSGDGVTAIGEEAFFCCENLKSIELGKSLKQIANKAFNSCFSLGYIYFDAVSMDDLEYNNGVFSYTAQNGDGIRAVIGRDVTRIPAYLFNSHNDRNGAPRITGVEFAEGGACESIGSYAFAYLDALTEVVIPESITEINNNAFYYCYYLDTVINLSTIDIVAGAADNGYVAYYASKVINGALEPGGYVFEAIDGESYLIKYIGQDKDLVLPESCNGEGYYIAEYTFAYSGITSVIIPDGVIGIGRYAFYECESLASVDIGGVGVIGDYAFKSCDSLVSATLDNGILSIGNYAFEDCILLEVIAIPDSVTSICAGAFYECCALRRVTLGGGVLSIGSYAFYNCINLEEIVIPDSVSLLSDAAFSGCTSLVSIVIGAGVSTMGNGAFYGCAAIEEIYFNAYYMDDLSDYNEVFLDAGINGCGINVVIGVDVMRVPAYLFCPSYTSHTPNIVSIRFNDSWCTVIGEYAFSGCTSLSSVSLSDNIMTIGESAFFGCEGLTSITIKSVGTIGDNAFNGCLNLSEVFFSSSPYAIGNGAFAYSGITRFQINDINSIDTIGNYLFYNCTNLESVDIPESVYAIGEYAFYNCTSLTDVKMHNSRVCEIGAHAFSGCTNLLSVRFSEELFLIGECAFSYCESLTGIEIPKSVSELCEGAFYNCTSLATVTNYSELDISAGSSDHGYVAYYAHEVYTFETVGGVRYLAEYTGSATDIILPDSYMGESYAIANDVFYGMGVRSVVIPDSVTSIGSYAFSNCTDLVSITLGDGVTSIGDYAFERCYNLETVTVGENIISIGTSAFAYCYALPVFVIPDSVTRIGSSAFKGCASLEGINIPDGVTAINGNTFDSCVRLKTVTFGANVQSIGKEAFNNTGIECIVIPDAVTSIGEKAFSNCSNLEDVTVGDGVTTIGTYAFGYCNSLETVTIGASVTSIGSGAFADCVNLATVINCSSLNIRVGYNDHGRVASYAREVICGTQQARYYTFETVGGVHYLTGYTGSDTELVLPTRYNGAGYVIGESVFANSSITSVVIPECVSRIDTLAFYNCRSLVTVINRSSLDIVAGSSDHGYVAYYATEVINDPTPVSDENVLA